MTINSNPQYRSSENIQLQVRKDDLVEISVEKEKGIEISVKEKLPDSDEPGGTTRICLENALIKRFHPGVDPAKLSLQERAEFLEGPNGLLSKVTEMHGKFSKLNPDDPTSGIEFETYTIKDPKRNSDGSVVPGEFITRKALKALMTWQMKIEVNGKTETIECVQYYKTGDCLLPKNPADLIATDHAKHRAILRTKAFVKMQKTGFLEGKYQINTFRTDRPPIHMEMKSMGVDERISHLRKSNYFDFSVYGNPHKFTGDLARIMNRDMHLRGRDGAADYAHVKFGNGKKFEILYDAKYDIAGRKKENKQLNASSKTSGVMKKFVKTNVYNPRGPIDDKPDNYDKNLMPWDEKSTPYGEHLYAKRKLATIKDDEWEAFPQLAKNPSGDIKGELSHHGIQNEQFREYLGSVLKKGKEDFNLEESRLRSNLVDQVGESPLLQEIKNKLWGDSAAEKLSSYLAQGLNDAVQNFIDAQSSDKAAAQQELEMKYRELNNFQNQIDKLKEHRKNISQFKEHLENLGPKPGGSQKEIEINQRKQEVQLEEIDKSLEKIDKKLASYENIEQALIASKPHIPKNPMKI